MQPESGAGAPGNSLACGLGLRGPARESPRQAMMILEFMNSRPAVFEVLWRRPATARKRFARVRLG